jgi:outer membrane protein
METAMTRTIQNATAAMLALALAASGAMGQAESQVGPGGSSDELSLEEAVRLALASYPAVAAADAGVDRAAGARREAAARWYPTVALSGSATRFEEPMIVRPLHSFDPTSPPEFDQTLIQGEATVAYTLFDGGRRGAQVRQADAGLGAAAADLDRTRAVVTAAVASAYLGVLSAGEVLDAHARRLEALRAEEARVRALLTEGSAPEIQLLRVQAALESAEADAVAARSDLATAEAELARLTGAPPSRTRRDRLGTIDLSPRELPDRERTAEALASNPEVRAARQAVVAAGATKSAARGARWPTVDAFATYWERGGGDTAFDGEWGAGLKVSVPVFTGGAVRGRVEQADAGERAALERLRLAELEAGRQVDLALARAEEADARVAALTRAVESQAAVVRTERVALEIGAGVQTDFLAAEAELLSARAALVRARHGAAAARIDLARLLGELDQEWIRTNLEQRP